MRRPPRGTSAAVLAALALVLASGAAGGPAPDKGRRTHTFGHSVEGRALQVKRSGSDDAAARVLVVGEIHGSETAGRAIVRKLRHRGTTPNVELWTVLDVNPDGVAAHTRQNAHGVDLNRNFPRGWRPQGAPGSTHYSGPAAASEPETRAAMRLIRRVHPDVTIWYHQALNLVDACRGADPDLIDRYAQVAGMTVKRLRRLPGTATRWQNHRFRRDSAFVVELPGGALSAHGVRRHARAVRATGRLAAA